MHRTEEVNRGEVNLRFIVGLAQVQEIAAEQERVGEAEGIELAGEV